MSQHINLYDPIFRKEEKPFSARTIGYALGGVALGLGALSAFAAFQAHEAEGTAMHSARQVASERERLLQATAKLGPRSRSQSLEAEVARLDAEVKARQNVLAALGTGELGNTAGFSEYLAALGRQSMPGVWLTALRIGESGNDLEVKGRALRPDLVPNYLRALNNEPVMRGRRVTEMKLAAKSAAPSSGEAKAQGPERYVEFTLTAPLRISEPAKGAAK